MKKIIITISFLLTIWNPLLWSATDPLVSNCVINAGANAKYLKDFRIQLGKTTAQNDLQI